MKLIDDTGLSHLIGKLKALIGLKADKTYVDNKIKTDVPVGAKFTDTVYTHPASHPASMITESSTKRFVSDSEKSTWNSKSDTDTVTTINGKTGAISKADIVALGIPASDTNTTYSEITTAEIDAGTSTALRTITGRRVKYILDNVVWDNIKGKPTITSGVSFYAGSSNEVIIPHGLSTTPTVVYAHPTTNPEGYLGEVWIRKDAENIYVGNTGSYQGALAWTAIT